MSGERLDRCVKSMCVGSDPCLRIYQVSAVDKNGEGEAVR